MTAQLANEVSARYSDIMFKHMDVKVVDYDPNGDALVLKGLLCCIIFRRGDTLVVAYRAPHETQWMFDAYA